MKKSRTLLNLLVVSLMFLALFSVLPQVKSEPEAVAADEFEIVMPWGTDHVRGKIIMSMIGNHTTLGTKYTYKYTAVGGGPADRDALTARFLAGDYPELIITTQDWYSEFSTYGIWENFAPIIQSWDPSNVTDIPKGWWSILDFENGDGTGNYIYALPFFGQSILPYINKDHFNNVSINWNTSLDTVQDMLTAAAALKADGWTPFAMVGDGSSDTTYMNYMMGDVDNYISARAGTDVGGVTIPATVKGYLNGTLNVEGLAAWLKLKGEGWTQPEVDTSGGGYANSLFGNGSASIVFCGPWGTSIFEDTAATAGVNLNFTAVPMFKCSDGSQSTITGGGITWVPKTLTNATMKADAMTLAEWLLDDENQMKTVDNWLNQAWRIPVKKSLASDPWFTAFPNRTNFVRHIESQEYAYPWGKQHSKWISIHESVLMPAYKDVTHKIKWNATGITGGYNDTYYTQVAQEALDKMAQEIEVNYIGIDIPKTIIQTTISVTVEPGTTVVETVLQTSVIETVSIVTSIVRASGFGVLVTIAAISSLLYIARRQRKK